MSAEEENVIVNKVIKSLEEKGLVVTTAAHLENLERQKTINRLLSRTKLTPYQIAKFKLIPGVSSLKTVKNMAQDGRLKKHEHYTDSTGKHFVLTTAVKRLRDE